MFIEMLVFVVVFALSYILTFLFLLLLDRK